MPTRQGEFHKFSLRGADDGEYRARVTCPVYITGAVDWAYFLTEQNAVKVYNVLERRHPDRASAGLQSDSDLEDCRRL